MKLSIRLTISAGKMSARINLSGPNFQMYWSVKKDRKNGMERKLNREPNLREIPVLR